MVLVTVLLAEVLYLVFNLSFALGLLLGVAVSALVGFMSVEAYREFLQSSSSTDGGSVSQKVSITSGGKYLIYAGVLAFVALHASVNFYTTAGGLLLPRFLVQLRALFRPHYGG
mgnify:CR=1 FL=1